MTSTNPVVDPTIDPTKFWVSMATPFIANTVCYIIAQLKKDNGIVDIMWG